MTSTFWGLRLEPGKRYSTTVDKSFHVSMAALDCGTVKNEKDIHCVMLEEGESSIPFILCNLNKPKILQSRLNLNFESGDRVTFFCRGSGIVHLTGYIIPEDDDLAQFGEDGEEVEEEEEEEEAEEEEDEEDEDEKEVSDKVSKLNGKVGKRKAEAAAGLAAKKKKKGIVEDSAEESDDDDENDEEEEDESADSDEEMDAESNDDSEIETSGEKNPSPLAVNQEQQQGKKKNKKNKQATQGQQSPSPGQQQQQGKQSKAALNGPQQKSPQQQQQQQQQQQKKKQQQQQTGNEKPQGKKMTLEGGVSVTDLKVGNGPVCKPGKMAIVYYTGRLKSNNKVFDQTSSGPGFKFRVGRGEVIKGWDIGLAGMKVGGKRLITCPPNMGYGQKGMPPTIPGNSTLMFEVELKGVN